MRRFPIVLTTLLILPAAGLAQTPEVGSCIFIDQGKVVRTFQLSQEDCSRQWWFHTYEDVYFNDVLLYQGVTRIPTQKQSRAEGDSENCVVTCPDGQRYEAHKQHSAMCWKYGAGIGAECDVSFRGQSIHSGSLGSRWTAQLWYKDYGDSEYAGQREAQRMRDEGEDEGLVLPPFTDASEMDSRVLEAAESLKESGILRGFPDGSFRPRQIVTRAETAKMIMLALGSEIPEANAPSSLRDVPAGAWYEKYVLAAVQKNILAGHPDGTFRPEDPVRTAEFLKIACLAFDLPIGVRHAYRDVPLDAWFSPYAGVAETFALFPGRAEGLLEPQRSLTRGDIAYAIHLLRGAVRQ